MHTSVYSSGGISNVQLSEWAKQEDVHHQTAWKWFKEGNPPSAVQTPSGTILAQSERAGTADDHRAVVYARVSSRDQRADLDRQAARTVEWATGQDMSAPEAATEVGSSVNGHRKKLLSVALGLYGVNDRGRAPRSIVTLRGRALGGCALSQSHKIVVVDDTEVEDDLAIDMTEAFDEFLRSPDALAPWRPEPGLEGSRLRRSSSAVRPACEYIEMGKLEVPHGWVCQAYRFEVARCCRHQSIASHQGARRFAWNWGLSLIEEQLHARGAYRVLALRQGATEEQSAAWARDMVPIPWSMIAIRRIWNEQKHEVAPWWGENSKEAYSSAFEALERAFKSYFSSRAGERRGLRVGWPKYKSRSQRRSVAFTTGAIAIVDRHHVKLPVIGVLRVKEPTDKLRLRIGNGSSRILRATLTGEGSATFVSFSVLVERHSPSLRQQGVCGHDVGISTLVTSSDGLAVENDRPADAQRLRISRYQRMMNRQHRTGSPNCFADNGAHIAGRCLWKNRSKRAKENQARLVKAHQRAARIRHDAIHKASYRTATTFSALCVNLL